MNALTLVDLLLELNVINVKDIDNEINKLAARLTDPRAQKWFRRVPRFFLINIDRLLKEPYVTKAEPRSQWASKYYANPKGGWVKGRGPKPGDTAPDALNAAFGGVRENYDAEKQTYTTSLHEPAVQRDIEQSFAPFKPTKAKAKRLHGEPPTKTELQPWMTAPGAEEKEFHHFDPIQTRRRELFGRLGELVNYLNWQTTLITKAKNPTPELEDEENRDDSLGANAEEAEVLLRKLETMKTDDIQGFRDVLKAAGDFSTHVKDKPWLFTKDGQLIARSGPLTLRKVIFPDTASMFSKRGQATSTSSGASADGNGDMPAWCTKSASTANSYLKDGPLYFVDKNNRPYVLAHFPSAQVYNVHDRPLDNAVAKEIAPLFADLHRFPLADLKRGNTVVADEVNRIRRNPR